jgi:putative pyruvate formate lyase activating enzyme
MLRQSARIRINDEGGLEVVDPGFDSLDLLRAVDPGFRVRRARLAGFTTPRLLRARAIPCGLTVQQLVEGSEAGLWEAHRETMEKLRIADAPLKRENEASLLDLKIKLARRILAHCRLCAHRCGIDRTRSELGVCRLGTEATVAEHFVHIAEEAPINPSLVLNLAGCGLRCRFCQQGALLDPTRVTGERLEPGLWGKLRARGARSLSFVGGNPDESLFAILWFLAAAPPTWTLPVVWNCHAYGTLEVVNLLEDVVDVYVPDLKYGNETCARRLSAVPNYPGTAQAAITAMLTQGVPVIVRMLVLPEHFGCCHAPALDFLATLNREQLCVSVRGQYCPDWKITREDGALARRTSREETEAVRKKARDLGLALID